MERTELTPRRLVVGALFVALMVLALYLLLPRLAGLQETWHRLEGGSDEWLAAAAVFELLSFSGYVWLFRGLFLDDESIIGWRESYQITMASIGASRLFGAGGAGGIALLAWALRRAGMEAREVASKLTTFEVLLYAVFMAALVIFGAGLRTGVFGGEAPLAFTILPAVFGGVAIAAALALTLLPHDLEHRIGARARRGGPLASVARALAAAPTAVAAGVRGAIREVRRRNPAVLGAIVWWGFDIAVLWASFRAFGASPPLAVIVLGYYCGQLGNLLPLPGGVGGVEGGMIGAFLAFGVDDGLAIVAVLAYRFFAFWLPTVPAALAYVQLRRAMRDWEPSEESAEAA